MIQPFQYQPAEQQESLNNPYNQPQNQGVPQSYNYQQPAQGYYLDPNQQAYQYNYAPQHQQQNTQRYSQPVISEQQPYGSQTYLQNQEYENQNLTKKMDHEHYRNNAFTPIIVPENQSIIQNEEQNKKKKNHNHHHKRDQQNSVVGAVYVGAQVANSCCFGLCYLNASLCSWIINTFLYFIFCPCKVGAVICTFLWNNCLEGLCKVCPECSKSTFDFCQGAATMGARCFNSVQGSIITFFHSLCSCCMSNCNGTIICGYVNNILECFKSICNLTNICDCLQSCYKHLIGCVKEVYGIIGGICISCWNNGGQKFCQFFYDCGKFLCQQLYTEVRKVL